MSIRKLFDKKIPYSIQGATDIAQLGREVESSGNMAQRLIEKNRFIPDVDFAYPANFAKFGSAEKYYIDAMERIYNQYPYDGSLQERTKFANESSYLDLYIFDERYPRRNGYGTIASEGAFWPPPFGGDPYNPPTQVEYIEFRGGPHGAPDEFRQETIQKQFPESNIYSPPDDRGSNLTMDGTKGTTIEFWFKHGPQYAPFDIIPPGGISNEVLFSAVSGSAYLELNAERHDTGNIIFLTLDARDGAGNVVNTTWTNITEDSWEEWNHYAFSMINSGSGTEFKLYINGNLVNTASDPDQIEEVNFISGALGASLNPIYGTKGVGKTSGSFDEFRFWKTQRTSQDIGRYWFTQVGGGTNTDLANTDLGIYYKFNEGITGRGATDSTVLDYSGRLSNGSWIGYPGSEARSTGSAMVLSDAAKFEFKDPIIYSFHPAVKRIQASLASSGSAYDHTNNASIYHSMPNWIIDEDEIEAGGALKTLTQVMSSYLDALYLQIEALPKIRDMVYDSDHVKPAPFASKLLESYGMQAPEIFVNADILAQILNRDEEREFEEQLGDIKNLIYKNIYNNLIYIYKSKGTMKSIRNLVHCYGVDEDLIRVNSYGNNVTYTLKDNFRPKAQKKKYADFNDTDRFQATVYQQTASGNPASRNFIAAQGTNTAFTAQCEVIFPRKLKESDPAYFRTPFLSSSIYGFHSASATVTDLTWGIHDQGLQVYAVRDQIESPNAYFQLVNTEGTLNLTSSLFYDIYDNKKWNLAFRLQREKPVADLVSGSTTPGNYILEFYGVNSEVDVVANEFYLTQSVDNAATGSIGRRKRFYVGAHRTNFTGSVLTRSDLKISSLRYWGTYLNNDVIKAHARDGANMGTLYPPKSAYLYPKVPFGTEIPQTELLALNWDFTNVTASGPGTTPNAYDAQYTVQDLSSGSLALASDRARFSTFANVVNRQHTGRGDFYLANDSKVVDLRYVYSGKQNLPEVVYSSDMIQIMASDDVTFTKESRPVDYYFQIEKSMYQTISDEMLNIFATIVDFNNLIGEPVNRYRQRYKRMEKLRQLFFERVENTPSLDKYVQFYEWIDASLNVMIQQLLPASANFSEDIRNMVESHILERNKYRTKFPTLEMAPTHPITGIRGINELLYNWKFGHAPILASISPAPQSENCFWWKQRAERDEPPLSSSASGVNASKEKILASTVRVLDRSYSTPYRLTVDKSLQAHGGVNFPPIKKIDYVKSAIKFGSTTGVTVGEVQPLKDCDDVYNPWEKLKLGFKATTNEHSYFSGKGDIFTPFSLYSSSIYDDVAPGTKITNLHTDTYGDDKAVPMQGPFTNYAVGGLQYRHVPFDSQLYLSETFTSQSKFDDNNGLDPAVWSFNHDVAQPRTYWTGPRLGSGTDGDTRTDNWAVRLAGLNNTIGTQERWLETVQKYDCPLEVIFGYAQGDFQNVTLVGYDLQLPNEGSSPLEDLLFQYSLDDGASWITQKHFPASDDNQGKDIGWRIHHAKFPADFAASSLKFRWYQEDTSGANLDNWAIDFVRITNGKERPEGWEFKNNKFTRPPITMYETVPASAYFIGSLFQPYAPYYRDEIAKRPVNIRNIHHRTGSTIMGNYNAVYDLVQTCGRRTNNRAFVKAGGFNLNPLPIYSEYILDVAALEYAKIQRGRTPHVFVNRFSAPGGPDTAGNANGGPGLDRASGELSSNNDVNYRNNFIRQVLQWLQTSHVGQFGYYTNSQNINGLAGSTVNPYNYAGTGSIYQVNRNPVGRIISGGLYNPPGPDGTRYSCKTTYDNYYIQHAIPQSDCHYTWTTASVLGCECPTGYWPYDGMDGAKPAVSFVSASSILAVPSLPFIDAQCIDFGKGPSPTKNYLECVTPSCYPSPFGKPNPGNQPDCNQSLGPVFTVSVWIKYDGAAGWGDGTIISRAKFDNGVIDEENSDWSLAVDDAGNVTFVVNSGPIPNPGATGGFRGARSVVGGGAPNLCDGDWHSILVHLASNWHSSRCKWKFWIAIDGIQLSGGQVSGINNTYPVFGSSDDRIPAVLSKTFIGATYDTVQETTAPFPGKMTQLAVWMKGIRGTSAPNTATFLAAYNSGCPPDLINDPTLTAIANYEMPTTWYRMGDVFGDSTAPGGIIHDVVTHYDTGGGGGPKPVLEGPINAIPHHMRETNITRDRPCPNICMMYNGGVKSFPLDFVGLNTVIVDELNPSVGLMSSSSGEYENTYFAWLCETEDAAAHQFRALICHRQGPYGWPTWKQIRGSENSLVRYYRKNNLITCNGNPGPTRIFKDGKTTRVVTDRFGSFKVYHEPAVTSQCIPIQHTFGLRTAIYPKAGIPYSTIEPATYQSTLGNNLELFTNEELNYCSGLKQCDPQAYDTFKGLYLDGALNEPSNPIYSFIELVYKERVYPAANNAHKQINRERAGYKNDFWKNSRQKRSAIGAKKWGGGGCK